MYKQQLDILCAVLNYCNELSGGYDSLTDIENNEIFAGLTFIDRRKSNIRLSLYGGSMIDRIMDIELDLNSTWDSVRSMIDARIAEEE